MRTDDKTVDLFLSPKFTGLWQRPRQDTLVDPASGGPLEMPTPEFQTAETTTSVSLLTGQSRLIALWPTKGDPALREDGICQGVFITAHAVKHRPPPAAFMLPPPPENFLTPVRRTFALPQELFAPNTSTAPEDLKDLFKFNGIPLPEQSVVNLNAARRVVVTTTAEMMPVVEAWAQGLNRRHLHMFNFTVEIIRAPASLLRGVIQDCAARDNHAPALRRLHDAVTSGQAQLITVAHQETRSGQENPSLFSGVDRHRITELTWYNQRQPTFATEHKPAGFTLALQPVAGLAPQTIELRYDLHRDVTPPALRQERIANTGLSEHFLVPRDEFRYAAVRSWGCFVHEQPRLVSAWCPVGESGRSEENVLEAAILTCRLVQNKPVEHEAGDAGGRSKKTAAPKSRGMQTRVFRISEAPFSTSGTAPENDSEPLQRPTVKDILEARGVTFPEGSSAIFDLATSRLQVHNTEPNLQLVEQYVRSLIREGPKMVSLTLHILEAPAAVTQKILADHAAETDHAPALKQLLAESGSGQVRSLATLNRVDKSGQRGAVSQV
ncbi:MAG TPA: hypothetical protein VD994_21900 [Prosthecobacter sp.]|nr:hypothetical protein [Prosthecobacter sp.]